MPTRHHSLPIKSVVPVTRLTASSPVVVSFVTIVEKLNQKEQSFITASFVIGEPAVVACVQIGLDRLFSGAQMIEVVRRFPKSVYLTLAIFVMLVSQSAQNFTNVTCAIGPCVFTIGGNKWTRGLVKDVNLVSLGVELELWLNL